MHMHSTCLQNKTHLIEVAGYTQRHTKSPMQSMGDLFARTALCARCYASSVSTRTRPMASLLLANEPLHPTMVATRSCTLVTSGTPLGVRVMMHGIDWKLSQSIPPNNDRIKAICAWCVAV